MTAYEDYNNGSLEDYAYQTKKIEKALKELPNITFGQ